MMSMAFQLQFRPPFALPSPFIISKFPNSSRQTLTLKSRGSYSSSRFGRVPRRPRSRPVSASAEPLLDLTEDSVRQVLSDARLKVHEIRDFFWHGIPSRGASWLREEPVEEVWQRVILVPVCGGVIVGILNSLQNSLKNQPEGILPHNIKSALGPFLKTTAAAVTLGTGNSLGPEGPSVEIGSAIAKGVGHVFEWSGGKKLSLVAAGSAAGIASGFNAAVAGCFFVVESVLWPSSTDSFSSLTNATPMVILSSEIASVVSEIGLGSDPAFKVPDYDFRSPSAYTSQA